MSFFSLENQTAVVTGAATGIGEAIARRLAEAGAAVAVADIDEQGAAEVASSIGGLAFPLALDITDANSVRGATGAMIERAGRLDILVNNAGIAGRAAPIEQQSLEEWELILRVNMTGAFLMCQSAIPHMREQRYGRIVNIASIAAVSGGRLVRNATAYATAKAGVIGMTKALAIEVADQGVTVNALAPGAQATPGRDRDTPERREALLAQIPTRLLGDPAHLAETVVFLASPAAVNVTGVVLPLDGGHSI
jgi:3-oxoacyl-[acyl-carrier protein] reductase